VNRRTVVSQKVVLAILALVVASLPASVRAQVEGQQAPGETGQPRWKTGLHVQGLFFDNFFQLPESEPQQDVEGLRAEGRLTWRPREQWPLEVYGVAGATAYSEDLEETLLAGGGLRWDGLVDRLDLGLRYEADRPSFEVGDTFGTADLLAIGGVYSHRIADAWEISALADHQRLDYEVDDGRDSFFRSAGGAVRYRGWGSRFSPEVGVEVGERDADDANEDNDQTDLWLKLRAAPVRPLYLSLRYRHRVRDYSVGAPAASNFRREDDRAQIALTADWRTSDLLTWTLYYTWEDADSTKETRIFDTQLLAIGVRLTP
jgi:hypothetical protein